MPSLAELILTQLDSVQQLRLKRQHDAGLQQRVQALKAYQQQRFARTHADLLKDPRHAPAARFFLEDLYGPQDFAERDAQFVRIVPALVRLFPTEIVQTVLQLASLHAVTEALDAAMAGHLPPEPLDAGAYVRAWQATGRQDQRLQQVALVLSVGRQLDQYTRSRVLRQTLRFMRTPARAAGLSALQAFLERGFDTFAAMGGAGEFMRLIETREQVLIARLFAPDAVALATSGGAGVADAIGQLP